MKKLLLFAVAAFAIASFGAHIGLAHAQTAPANNNGSVDNATLLQELQVAKATLVNLQMQAGMVPAGDDTLPGSVSTVTPTTGTTGTGSSASAASGLSASDRAALSSALGSLVSALSSLNASIAANPSAVTSHGAAIASVLSGMQNTLVAINSAVLTGSVSGGHLGASSPVAVNNPKPSTGSTGAGSGVTQSQPSTPSKPSTPAAGGSAPQTAQASNAWGFVVAHWPTITIIILVALILLILFWPSKGDEGDKHAHKGVSRPQTPNRPISQGTAQSTVRTETPATPVATAVSAPAAKVTVIRPQNQPAQQQKRPA